MTTHRIKPDRGPDLVFEGTRLARVSSDYPGKVSWSVLSLYKTQAGSYVGVRQHVYAANAYRVPQPDEPNIRTKAIVLDDAPAVVAWFGLSWLSKELFDEAGIAHETRIP